MFTFRESDGLPALTWCLKFDGDTFSEWKDQITIYLWEGKNRISYAKAKADEQRYIQGAFEDVEMTDPEEVASDDEDEAQDSTALGDEKSEDEGNQPEKFAQGSKNDQLAVGYKNDLSFVTRGDMIGVFAPKDEKMRFRTTIDRVKDLKGKTFSPRKVRSRVYPSPPLLLSDGGPKIMLHNQDSDMLLLDPANQNSVYRMDLEYGKIVDEWKISDAIQVSNILPEFVRRSIRYNLLMPCRSKYAQMNPQQTLIGHCEGAVLTSD